MKKSRSLMHLFGTIFMIIGLAFTFAGQLNRLGVLPTSPNSKGDPGIIFPIVGIAFLIIAAISFRIEISIQKKCKRLKAKGIRIEGTVTNVEKVLFVKFGKQSPYYIYFTYQYSGEKYEGRSYLVWSKPVVSVGDGITVYIDEYNKHQYFAEV